MLWHGWRSRRLCLLEIEYQMSWWWSALSRIIHSRKGPLSHPSGFSSLEMVQGRPSQVGDDGQLPGPNWLRLQIQTQENLNACAWKENLVSLPLLLIADIYWMNTWLGRVVGSDLPPSPPLLHPGPPLNALHALWLSNSILMTNLRHILLLAIF